MVLCAENSNGMRSSEFESRDPNRPSSERGVGHVEAAGNSRWLPRAPDNLIWIWIKIKTKTRNDPMLSNDKLDVAVEARVSLPSDNLFPVVSNTQPRRRSAIPWARGPRENVAGSPVVQIGPVGGPPRRSADKTPKPPPVADNKNLQVA
jgi:hypothetical protein